MDTTTLKERISRLEFQNRRLSETVEVQKSELVEKDKTIESKIQHWSEAETSILAIQRSWKQLSEDLILLASKHELEVNPHESSESNSVFLDSFVRALFQSSSSNELEKEVEEAAKTTEAFAEELDLEIKAESSRLYGLLAQILDQLKDRPSEASQDPMNALEESCNQLRGLNRTLVEKSRLLESKIFAQDSELAERSNQLAEVQSQLQNAKRKIEGHRQDEESRKRASENQPPPDTVLTPEGIEFNGQYLVEELMIKTEELETLRSEHQKTQQDLCEAKNHLESDTRIMETKLYKQLANHYEQLHAKVAQKDGDLHKLNQSLEWKDQELSRCQTQNPEIRQTTLDALREAEEKCKDLRQQLIDKDRALHDRGGSGVVGGHQERSSQVLKELVKNSQEEVQRLKRRLKDKEDSSCLEKAREDSMNLYERLRSTEDELEQLRHSLKESKEARKQQEKRIEELYKNKEDLKVFIDTLSTCDIPDEKYKESELKSRERNLTRANEALKRKLADLESPEHADLLKKAESCQSRMNEMTDQLFHLRDEKYQMEKTLENLRTDLDQKNQLQKSMEEMFDGAGAAYEELQSQNLELVTLLGDRENEVSHLKSQKAELTDATEGLYLQLKNLQEELNLNKAVWPELEKLKMEYQGMITELQAKIQRLKRDLQNRECEIGELQQTSAMRKAEQNRLHLELGVAQEAIESRSKALEQETELRLTECSRRQKTESEWRVLSSFKRKIRSAKAQLQDFDRRDEIELQNLKIENLERSVNCPCCSERPRAVVLTTCWHTSCQECIEETLASRRRRCLTCGLPFGRDNVHQIFL